MKPQDAEKLLGGYAAGILTAEERQALFAAALEDQALFDALANEEALRELLADPAARAHLLASLEVGQALSLRRPLWPPERRPAGHGPAPQEYAQLQSRDREGAVRHAGFRAGIWAMAGAAVAAVLVLVFLVPRFAPKQPKPVLMARQTAPPPAPAPAVAPEPPKPAPVRRPRVFTAPEAKPSAPPILELAPRESGGVVGGIIGGVPPGTYIAAPPPPPLRIEALRMAPSAGLASAELMSAALNYEILRAGRDGAYMPVQKDAVLHVGDQIRLRFEAGVPGILDVYAIDAPGIRQLLFHEKVEPGKSCVLPAAGSLAYSAPGKREFEAVVVRVEASKAALRQAVVSRDAAAPTMSVRFSLDIQ